MRPMFTFSGDSFSLNLDESASDSGIPLWLEKAREDDVEYFSSCKTSLFKGEEWKYTDPSEVIRKASWIAGYQEKTLPSAVASMLINGAFNIVVVDGKVQGEQHSFHGMTMLAGSAASSLLNPLNINALTRNDTEFFCRLNHFLFRSPLLLRIDPGQEIQELIHIIHVNTPLSGSVFPRVYICVGAGASVNILQTFYSPENTECLSAPVTDILINEGAKAEYAEHHAYSSSSAHIGSVRAWQKKESEFRSLISTSGAGLFRSNLSVMLEEEGASAYINGLHRLQGNTHADSHTLIEHFAPGTSSNQLYKCVLEGVSRSVFNGRIFVHREAQRANSYQLNKNLLLSHDCRVDTKPQLEIQADDVKCTHGATIGQLDEEQLFYLQTRAIERKEAVRMLVRGFMDDVLLRIRHPLIREALR